MFILAEQVNTWKDIVNFLHKPMLFGLDTLFWISFGIMIIYAICLAIWAVSRFDKYYRNGYVEGYKKCLEANNISSSDEVDESDEDNNEEIISESNNETKKKKTSIRKKKTVYSPSVKRRRI